MSPWGRLRSLLAGGEGGEAFDDADLIWNRACDSDFEPTREGDQILKTAIAFDGLIANGGLAFAVDANYRALAPTADALRRLGAGALAEILDQASTLVAPHAVEENVDILDLTERESVELERLNDRYGALSFANNRIDEAFRAYLARHPDDFGPVTRAERVTYRPQRV